MWPGPRGSSPGTPPKTTPSLDWEEGLPIGETEAAAASYEPLASVVRAQAAQQTSATPPTLAPALIAAANKSEAAWAAFERRGWLEPEFKRLAGKGPTLAKARSRLSAEPEPRLRFLS